MLKKIPKVPAKPRRRLVIPPERRRSKHRMIFRHWHRALGVPSTSKTQQGAALPQCDGFLNNDQMKSSQETNTCRQKHHSDPLHRGHPAEFGK